MNPLSKVVGVLACTLLTSCFKDGIDPPATVGSTLDVRFDFHCDGKPFSLDSVYADGLGTVVRFTRLRFALHGAELLGDQGQDMGTWPDAVLLADITDPARSLQFPQPKTGEIHWMDSRTCGANDTPCSGTEVLIVTDHGPAFMAVLDVQGLVDGNANGRIDPADTPFRITVAPDDLDPAVRIHAHAVVGPNGAAVLEVPVNVTGVLRDIDLPDEPITIGEGAYAAQALANFRTHVLGVDNRPQ